jgi:Fe-S oxidoreductase
MGASSGKGKAVLLPDLRDEMERLDARTDRRARFRTFGDAYRFDECIECGTCLLTCRYRDLDKEQSREGIRKLRRGEETERYLSGCLSCGKCNHRCPRRANPGALMLQRLADIRQRDGTLPRPLSNYINGMRDKGWEHNDFRNGFAALDDDSREILGKWSEPQQGDDLFFVGCGYRSQARRVERSRVLADLPRFGGENDCCGIPAAKAGLFDISRYITNNLIDRLSRSRFRRLVVSCGSCHEQFVSVFPKYLGQEFPFEVISIYEYIYERLKSGKATVTRKVEGMEMVVSDACYGYEIGDDYLNAIRRLARSIGVTTHELPNTGKKSACCGAAAFFRRGSLEDVFVSSWVKAAEIEASGKDVLTYCGGCQVLGATLYPRSTYLLLDLLLWALGDDVDPFSGK